MPRLLSTPAHRAYLKVTEGCNNRCSYCLIPSIRGRQRSRAIDDLVKETRNLEKGGVRELTLIAQDLTAYGTDLGTDGPRLPDLLEALLQRTALPWIRMLYLHPARLDRRVIELAATEGRIAPYFDIPLQHVSNKVLKRMRRPYTFNKCTALVQTIRALHPDAALRTTFMVGFRARRKKMLLFCLPLSKNNALTTSASLPIPTKKAQAHRNSMAKSTRRKSRRGSRGSWPCRPPSRSRKTTPCWAARWRF